MMRMHPNTTNKYDKCNNPDMFKCHQLKPTKYIKIEILNPTAPNRLFTRNEIQCKQQY